MESSLVFVKLSVQAVQLRLVVVKLLSILLSLLIIMVLVVLVDFLLIAIDFLVFIMNGLLVSIDLFVVFVNLVTILAFAVFVIADLGTVLFTCSRRALADVTSNMNYHFTYLLLLSRHASSTARVELSIGAARVKAPRLSKVSRIVFP